MWAKIGASVFVLAVCVYRVLKSEVALQGFSAHLVEHFRPPVLKRHSGCDMELARAQSSILTLVWTIAPPVIDATVIDEFTIGAWFWFYRCIHRTGEGTKQGFGPKFGRGYYEESGARTHTNLWNLAGGTVMGGQHTHENEQSGRSGDAL